MGQLAQVALSPRRATPLTLRVTRLRAHTRSSDRNLGYNVTPRGQGPPSQGCALQSPPLLTPRLRGPQRGINVK